MNSTEGVGSFDNRRYQIEYGRSQTRLIYEVEIPPIKSKSRRTRAIRDIEWGLRTYFPKHFYHPFTTVHREMIHAIRDAIEFGGDHAVAAPRGEGKSTIFACLTILMLLSGRVRYPILVGSNERQSTDILKAIKTELEWNDKLFDDFPEVIAPIRHLEGDVKRARRQTVRGEPTHMWWSNEKLVMPIVPGSACSNSVVETRAPGAAIRGIYHNSPINGRMRPDLVLIDDIETRESADSLKMREFTRALIEGDMPGLAGQGRQISRVMLCTCWSRESLSWKYTDPSSGWDGKRYKLLVTPPTRADLWDRYMQMRKEDRASGDQHARRAHGYYLTNRRDMDDGAVVSNPFRHITKKLPDGTRVQESTLQFCYDFMADKTDDVHPLRFFNEEFQNDPPELGEMTSGLTSNLVQNRLSGYPKGIVPSWAKCVTGFIDVGKFNCHWIVTAWSPGAKGVVIDYGVAEVYNAGDTAEGIESAIFNALNRWKDETNSTPYRDEEGQERCVDLTLVDSGFHPLPVYRFCQQAGLTFRPSKGFGETAQDSHTRYNQGVSSDKKKVGDHWDLRRQENGLWLVCMDSDYWKRWVHDRFLTQPEHPGSLTLYGGDPYPHFAFSKHILAEQEVEEWIHGKGMRRFWKKMHRNNHWFDCMYGSACAGSILGVRLLQEIAHLVQERIDQEQSGGTTSLPTVTRRDGRPWVTPAGRKDGRGWLDR